MDFDHPLRLEARRLYEIQDAAAVSIRCLQGSLWLTLDHDPRDIVLEPGDSFDSPAHRRCLLYALEPASFVLQARPAAEQARRALAAAA